jgi:hypothetical protein
MIVTLRRTEATSFEGHGVRGFISVETENGKSKLYVFRFPTREEPDPPGWAWLARHGVSTDAIIAGWNEDHSQNHVAERTMIVFSTRYGGSKFLLTESKDASLSTPVAMLSLIDPSTVAPRRIDIETSAAELVPARYIDWSKIDVDPGEPGDAAHLVIQIDAIEPAKWPRFRAPDQQDRNPPDWWFVETFTGIAHERVASSWGKEGRNRPLEDAVRLLAQALSGHPVPLSPDGTVDLNRYRREVVRARLTQGVKPFVFIGRPDLTIDHTKAIFTDTAGPFLFRTGYEEKKSYGWPAMIANNAGAMLKNLDDEDDLRTTLVKFVRFASSGHPPKPKNPSKELVRAIMRFPDVNWPPILGIARIPTMREDGSILSMPGYDASSKLWFAPEFELAPIPEIPSNDDIERAKTDIVGPFVDFPFVEEAGALAGAIACLVEQVVRPMIKGPRPLYVFDAPPEGQGTGKTLLAKTIQTVITGQSPRTSPAGRREEEIEKRITTLLREGDPFIILDNLEGIVSSSALAQLATGEGWRARLLNTNEAPILPQIATWVLTLNNAQLNRDLSRRIVMVRLDAKVPNPNKRTGWTIKEKGGPPVWALARRANIIRACLIIARSWVNAGRPEDPNLVLGSFESWVHVVGGIIHHAQISTSGLAKAVETAAERDTNLDDHRTLVRMWLSEQPNMALPAIEIGRIAQKYGLYENRLLARGTPESQGRRMAEILKGVLGQIHEGHKIDVYPQKHNGHTCYVLTPVN